MDISSDWSVSVDPKQYAVKLVRILNRDLDDHLARIDDYVQGEHDDPYMPDSADAEYKLLAKRAVSNWCPLLISTPAQALYVDSFRSSRVSRNVAVDALGQDVSDTASEQSPEWDHWQRSRMDAKQNSIHRGAIGYGHSFTLTELDPQQRAVTKGLSPLKTSAIFEDPANDATPEAALTVLRRGGHKRKGKARMWVGPEEYEVTFNTLMDTDSIRVLFVKTHPCEECPVTRFTCFVDLEGRTTGVVEPVIPLQNRINQTVFDLLIAQSFNSWEVRTVSGMAPPFKTRPVLEDPNDPNSEVVGTEPVIDPDTGQPVPAEINMSARRFLFAEDPDTKFGSLSGGSLSGYIESIDMSIRHLSAVTQTPPHHLLGQVANLSAEALQAAETSLSRMVEGFRKGFGESWERVFRLAAELEGDMETAGDFASEVIWRDMELRSLSQTADALGKLTDQLHIPARGLWPRVPGATKPELEQWAALADEEDSEFQLIDALNRAAGPPSTPVEPEPVDVG